MVLFVDSHPDRRVVSPIDQVFGWARLERPCDDVVATVHGVETPFARKRRPDVEALGPEPYLGFSLFLDLPSLGETTPLEPGPVEVAFASSGETIARFTLEVADAALARNAEILANHAEKRAFIDRSLRRPLAAIEGCRAPSALPEGWPVPPDVRAKTDAVSAHGYGKVVLDFIAGLGPDAFILDAGAGLRRHPHRNVVAMEIYDYPSTDILAVGQDLPFADGVFDGAISIAVLEHVDDPFACARELVRVVKPGGKLFVIVPFLQAEHGYPSHYFNATRFGMRKLFSEGVTLERHWIEMSNHPVFTLNQILSLYALGLPKAERERFLDTPVREFVTNAPAALHQSGHEFVTKLSENAQWTLAWGTTATFVKDG